MLVFYLLLLPSAVLGFCPSFSYDVGGVCLPCGVRCSACSTSVQCSTCSTGYYLNTNGSCSTCLENCRVCSGSVCTQCEDPYVLVDGTCQLCTILNAAACSSLTTVTKCSSSYYSAGTYCGSCILHCKVCANSTICQQCDEGYLLQYQNSVCGKCVNCKACVGTPDNCTACWNGNSIVQNGSSFACSPNACNIPNCLYCSADSVCGNCNSGYFLSGGACVYGASLLCSAGAVGSRPNQCSVGNFWGNRRVLERRECCRKQLQWRCVPIHVPALEKSRKGRRQPNLLLHVQRLPNCLAHVQRGDTQPSLLR